MFGGPTIAQKIYLIAELIIRIEFTSDVSYFVMIFNISNYGLSRMTECVQYSSLFPRHRSV